ncbi:MAG: phytoene dehydrogenase-like protein [Planctomycetota bacterium]
MANKKERAIVLGADIEGLAAAATLAKAGLKVKVVDAMVAPGGASRALEFHPGHVAPGLLHETALVRQKLLAHLELEKHGLAWRSDERPVHVMNAQGKVQTVSRGAISDSPSAGAYVEWRNFVDKLSPLIADVLDDTPPEAVAPSLMEMFSLAKKGLRMRSLGEKDMMELMRIVTMPAWDWMEERFEDQALRAALTALALPGTVIGPRAAGTTAMILMREAARGAEPLGGLAAVTDALMKCCKEMDVQFHLGAKPKSIQTDSSGIVSGVQLENGELLETDLMLSALSPQETLLDLTHPGLIPHHVETEVQSWRTRGSSAILLLALDKPANLPGKAERLITATTPLELERAADALKYGELPSEPWLDVRDWGQSDANCAPAGAGTLSIHVHGVSHALSGGWNDAARKELSEKTLTALEKVLPGVRASIVREELLTPVEIEQRFGLRGGQIYGGEQVLDQLWVQRPALALCRYETPVPGLFLAGASSHPGGPFIGGAGVLAARRALV